MGKYLDEIRLLTDDPASRRLGEIADMINSKLTEIELNCCGGERLNAPAAPTPPAATPK